MTPAHAKHNTFQLAELAVPGQLFAAIMERIGRLRLTEASGVRFAVTEKKV